MLPNFAFYELEYHGNQISQEDFPRLISRAGDFLAGFPGIDTESVVYKKAACSVAEAWQVNEQGGDIVSQSVGSWSRAYQKKPKSDEQRLLNAARMYLPGMSARWV